MIRTTIVWLGALAVLVSCLYLVPKDFAQTPATAVAYRKGLFRRLNSFDAQQSQAHQPSPQSIRDGYGATEHHDIDVRDIPRPVEYDELDVFLRLQSLAANQIRSEDPTADIAPRELDATPTDDTSADDTSADDTSADDTSADDTPTDDTPTDDTSADDNTQPPASSAETPEFAAEMIELRADARRCLAHYFDIKENAGTRSPWGIMHALIAYGVDTEIYANNQKVNAIGWLCFNGAGRGQRLFYINNGRIAASEGPGVQGHAGQFLAMLAQSRVKSDYPIRVNGREFTVEDLINYEKDTCRARSELTFKLIGLSHYLDSDATWKNDRGEDWDIPRLIKEELAQSIVGAACGGTHRLMGFSYAVARREKQGKEVSGQWHRAKQYVADFHNYTFSMQNPDGSFSTNWFEGRGDLNSRDRKLQTTGHILEWMVYSLPPDKLQDPRLVRTVRFLTDLMLDGRNYDWEIGPRGHAIHALVMYDQRLFGGKPGNRGPKITDAKPLDALN